MAGGFVQRVGIGAGVVPAANGVEVAVGRVAKFGGGHDAGCMFAREVETVREEGVVDRVHLIQARMHICIGREQEFCVAAPAGRGEVGEIAVLENEGGIAAGRVGLELAIQRRVEEGDVGDGAPGGNVQPVIEQFLFDGEIGQMNVLRAINFLHGGVVADVVSGQIAAMALRYGDMDSGAGETRDFAHVEIAAEEDLSRIIGPLADAAGGVARSFTRVVQRDGDAVVEQFLAEGGCRGGLRLRGAECQHGNAGGIDEFFKHEPVDLFLS